MQAQDSRRLVVLPWLALAVAFSPVLWDLLLNTVREPVDRVALLSPLLIGLSLRGQPTAPPRRSGLWLLGAGAALQVFGLASGSLSVARVGLPVGFVGLSRWTGRPRLGTSLLAFGIVPLPDTLYAQLTPAAETMLARLLADSLASVWPALDASGPLLRGPGGALELRPSDTGVPVAIGLALIGWYAAVREGAGLGHALQRAVAWSLLALPAQSLGLLAGVAGLAGGHPDLARGWLTHGVWLAAALSGLGFATWARRGTRCRAVSSPP